MNVFLLNNVYDERDLCVRLLIIYADGRKKVNSTQIIYYCDVLYRGAIVGDEQTALHDMRS